MSLKKSLLKLDHVVSVQKVTRDAVTVKTDFGKYVSAQRERTIAKTVSNIRGMVAIAKGA